MRTAAVRAILGRVQITRLGHATLLIETPYLRILFDPGGYSTDWHGLAEIDAVFITHQHPDHVDTGAVADLMRINPIARLVTEEAVVPMLAAQDLTAEPARPGDVFEVGPARIEAVGGTHALIHESIPRVGNVGFVMSEADGPRVFHPGDSYEYTPDGVDVLALPITAPWAKVGATADFLAAVAPTEAFPIHDAILSGNGRELYMRVVGNVAGDAVTLHPLGATDTISV